MEEWLPAAHNRCPDPSMAYHQSPQSLYSMKSIVRQLEASALEHILSWMTQTDRQLRIFGQIGRILYPMIMHWDYEKKPALKGIGRVHKIGAVAVQWGTSLNEAERIGDKDVLQQTSKTVLEKATPGIDDKVTHLANSKCVIPCFS